MEDRTYRMIPGGGIGRLIASRLGELYGRLGELVGLRMMRFLVLLFGFGSALSASLVLAWLLRFDFQIPQIYHASLWHSVLLIVPLKLVVLYLCRQFAGMLTYFAIRDLLRLFGALAGSAAIVLLIRGLVYVDPGYYTLSRGVILIDFVLSFVGLAGFRLFLRMFRERLMFRPDAGEKFARKNVAIMGAGHFAANLAVDLFTRHGLGLRPVLFFDDDEDKWNSRVHDLPVLGRPELLLQPGFAPQLDKLIISLPGGASKRIREVVKIAQRAGIKCQIVPSMEEIATGKVCISQLRDVQIQDLLGRDPVQLEAENIRQLIEGKTIMVTGAGGSIGSELCRQVAHNKVDRLLLVERCEVQLFKIEQELVASGFAGSVIPLVADILDRDRMGEIFWRFRPEGVFHAAAHKHVPMMEHQPAEAFRNNAVGSRILAELAGDSGVEFFLLVSTDKAINPTSVMGATKRLAETFLQSFNAIRPGGTKFFAVRFGNVLGSSGSVVPIFEQQIARGGPVKVTHPQMTRYFMTIPEAVGLVLQSAVNADGGEIFVLDMGEPVKIVDLARQLIELHGRTPGTDIDIEFTGLRPGEKLFEEISHSGENFAETEHPEIMRYVCEPQAMEAVLQQFEEINTAMHLVEGDEFKRRLQEAIPEYTPFFPPAATEAATEERKAARARGREAVPRRVIGLWPAPVGSDLKETGTD